MRKRPTAEEAKQQAIAKRQVIENARSAGILGALGTADMGRFTGVDRLTAYLATTPGGLFAVLATAADSGSDVTYVLAVQVIRVFAMLLFAPLLGRWFRRRPS